MSASENFILTYFLQRRAMSRDCTTSNVSVGRTYSYFNAVYPRLQEIMLFQ
jgi:hypothetical protein